MLTKTQKSPALSVKPVTEGAIGSIFARLKQAVYSWAKGYDNKLDALKAEADL